MESKISIFYVQESYNVPLAYPKLEIIKDDLVNPQDFTPNIFSQLHKTTKQMNQNLLSDSFNKTNKAH
jgi:hypothetical protein